MELEIKDFYIDLFSSFHYKKERIDEQLERDFNRLDFYFHSQPIHTKGQFYKIINQLPIARLYKRLIWIIPTQATLFPFFKYINDDYRQRNYIVAEIPENCQEVSNQYCVYLDIVDRKYPRIVINKNFRILKPVDTDKIGTYGYVYLTISFVLGRDKYLNIQIKKEDLKLIQIE